MKEITLDVVQSLWYREAESKETEGEKAAVKMEKVVVIEKKVGALLHFFEG